MDHHDECSRSLSGPQPGHPRFGRPLVAWRVVPPLTTCRSDGARASAPESFADLADEVTDAVVNISASTTVEARSRALPQLPPGTPFEDLFEEFFNRRGQGKAAGRGDSAPQRQRRSNSLGSGFVIDPSGIVVTNNHVIGDANDISVIFPDGTRLKAEIVGKDSKVDLAVLKVKSRQAPEGGEIRRFRQDASGRLGDGDRQPVRPRRLGHGRHRLGARPQHRVRPLRQLHPDRRGSSTRAIPAARCSTWNGEVIGINTAILSPTGGSVGIGFAVPASTASARHRTASRVRRDPPRLARRSHPERRRRNRGGSQPRFGARRPHRRHRRKGPGKTGRPRRRRRDRQVRRQGGARSPATCRASSPRPRSARPSTWSIVRKGKELTKAVTLGRLEDGEKQQASLSRPHRPIPRRVTRQALGPQPFAASTTRLRRRFSLKDDRQGRGHHPRRSELGRRRQAHPGRRGHRRGRAGASLNARRT